MLSSPALRAASAALSPWRSRRPARGSASPARKAAALASLADRLGPSMGAQASFDVTDEAAVGAAVGAIRAAAGPIDILVNNAGNARSASFERTDAELWSEMLAVNLTGSFLVTRAVASEMLARRAGRIVNIASHRRAQRLSLCLGLCGGQAWPRRPDPGAGPRIRPQGRDGQRRLPRLYRHADAGCRHRRHRGQDRTRRGRRARDAGRGQSERAPRHARRKSPMRCFGWSRPAPLRSPARRSWWPAAK